MSDHVLVPFDGSAPARHALEHALENFPGAEITVLTVIDEVGRESEYAEAEETGQLFASAKRRLETADAIAEECGGSIRRVADIGPTCETITEYAETADVDHVVIGTHGRTGIARIVVGSVAETVVRQSSSPVTAVK
ncbi:UspA domain-containing protein [Haloterrigena salina JCM 13891]|uniref:UspA domain-containing protein n=1 Tax=Haloterrigena salina JCM 13891 TaxID=1227488 RepID=M0C1Y4_9EURY|nr:universal stress protein [Haloterrigena salina]ELZ17296.1 UspA domain-containing protein [Haloterrigena salina JCM 13891]